MRQTVRLAAVLLCITVAGPGQAQVATDQQRRQALEHYRSAIALMAEEQFERATVEFSAAIADDRLLSLAHYGLGQAFMRLQRYPSAIKAFDDCVDVFRELHALALETSTKKDMQYPDDTRELQDTLARMNQSGSGGALRQMRVDQMLKDLERDRQRGPNATFRPPAEVLLALGSAHFRNGDLDDAETSWKAAVDSNPKLGEAHNNLAVIYMQSGRLDEAEEEVKLAEKSGFRVNPQFKSDLKARRNAR